MYLICIVLDYVVPGLWNYKMSLLVHKQVNGQYPFAQPRFTCRKTDIFLISGRKHMLWVLNISASVKHMLWYSLEAPQ